MKNKLFPIFMVVFVLALLVVSPVAAQGQNPPADSASSGIDLAYVGQLLQALILAIIPVLGASATHWLLQKAKTEKARLTSEQQFILDTIIKTIVFAAEQMHLSGYIGDKLQYAEGQVQAWCVRNKIYLDVAEIRARIEAAVLTEFNIDPEALPAG